MLLIDKYAYTNKLTNSNPFIKFVIVVIALAIVTITKSNYINLLIMAIMIGLTTIVAGIPIDRYFKMLLIPSTFLLLSIVTILFSISKVDSYIWSISLFDNYIGITYGSIEQAVLLITRVFAAISSTFFLGLTTPINKLISVFKRMHIPIIMIELIVLIYRFIFVFLEEAYEIGTIFPELTKPFTGRRCVN